MTDAIEFGPEIKRGSPLWPEGQERPVWLADDVRFMHTCGPDEKPVWHGREWDWVGSPNWEARSWVWVKAIRLPASHLASIAQRWNDDNPGHPDGPFNRPHFGSEGQPSDWDGGDVLLRDGRAFAHARSFNGVQHCGVWTHDGHPADIIAYRSKTSEQTVEDDGYVRMTEREVRELLAYDAETVIETMRKWGFVETPVERFKRENPGLSGDELLEKALGR